MANTVVTSACSEHKAQGILVEKQPFSGILKVTCFKDMLFGLCFGENNIVLLTPTVNNTALHVTYITKRLQSAGSPAVDHNGFVSSPPLYHQHLLNDCHDGRRRGAQTLRSPAGHLELSHFVLLARLQEDM